MTSEKGDGATQCHMDFRGDYAQQVLPLSVVDNSAYSPKRLTTPIDSAYPSFK